MNLDRIGKYRIVGKIGQGAMGEVYKAHDPLLNRYVALKTISPALAADSEFRERFKREAQSAARLNHPNIVTVFDFGEESGHHLHGDGASRGARPAPGPDGSARSATWAGSSRSWCSCATASRSPTPRASSTGT